MKRYAILAAAMLVDMLLGFQYTWGTFDANLKTYHGFTATQTQSVFAAQIVMFAVTFIFAGWVLHHIGPRVTTMIGGITYGASLVIGGTFGQNPSALFWGTGVLFGVGLAFTYIGPLVTAVKWFPKYKGVASGLVVASYGCGSLVLAWMAKRLLGDHGDGIMSAFQVLNTFGVMGIVGITLLSLALVNPPGGEVEAQKGRFPAGLLKTGHFWALVVGFFAGTAAGLAIVGSIKSIGDTLGTPAAWTVFGVMVFAAGNTVGRIAWGSLTELIGTRRAIAIALLAQSGLVVAMILAGAVGPVYLVLTLFIGFNYGANFVLFVTDVSKTFGANRVGSVYGLINIIYMASGFLGAPAAGYSYDHWESYVPSMSAAAAVLLTGAVAFLLLYRQPRKEEPEKRTEYGT